MFLCIHHHMPSVAKIPEDVIALKALVLRQAADFARREQEQQQHWQQALQEQQAEYQTEIERLREQVRLLLARRFGASREASSPDQLGLFHEAMEEAAPETAEPETVAVPAHQRAKRGRRPLPEDLPRREVIQDLSEEEKICPHDGARLEPMGDDISEQLVPKVFLVSQRQRHANVAGAEVSPQCKGGGNFALTIKRECEFILA